jgi:NAD(P)-dependent dehydrogenase (short-subunit alcohol dehydrogenase family)
MQDFRNKVAVVTGAASGIGRALAKQAAHEGMKLVLADIEEGALAQAAEELRSDGADVLAVVTDVSKAEQVDALCKKTLEHFGAVHLLFNNAGIGAGHSSWGSTLADWEWVINVNLKGVIHCIHSFVPVMLRQKDACRVINTASIAGLQTGAFSSPYTMSKHAVVGLSESLHNELESIRSAVRVSVLCPGFVQTNIMDSARNRPAGLVNPPPAVPPAPEMVAAWQRIRDKVNSGMPPSEVADNVFAAIRADRFYILTHPETKEAVAQRMEDLIAGRNPSLPPGWGK